MRTPVALQTCNCPRCHNQLLRRLLERESVRNVRSDFSAGCLVIEHADDPDTLLALISTTARAVGVAANGEKVMVPVEAHTAADCQLAH